MPSCPHEHTLAIIRPLVFIIVVTCESSDMQGRHLAIFLPQNLVRLARPCHSILKYQIGQDACANRAWGALAVIFVVWEEWYVICRSAL